MSKPGDSIVSNNPRSPGRWQARLALSDPCRPSPPTSAESPPSFLAALSYLPQVRRAWPRGSTEDLSLAMLAALTLGLALWILYGAIQGD